MTDARGRRALPRGYEDARLQERFLSLLERHVSGLRIRGNRATGLSPCHDDHRPSFSADLERCIWYCFACAHGGGVQAFASLVGEAWSSTHSARRSVHTRHAALARRRHAEQQARAILQRRKEEREDALWAERGAVDNEAAHAAELLALFHRRPDLAAEFPDLLAKTEQEYGEVLFQRSLAEARIAGELA